MGCCSTRSEATETHDAEQYHALNTTETPSKRMQFVLGAIGKKWSNISHISTDHLAEQLKDNADSSSRVIILDIREEYEYNISNIQNAVRVPPKATPEDIINIVQNEQNVCIHTNEDTNQLQTVDIYCYCSVGYRSSIVAQKLQKYGVRNVHNVSGSIFKWVNEERPIVDNAGHKVDKVHTYNRLFSVLVDDVNKRIC
eukprot:252386_1